MNTEDKANIEVKEEEQSAEVAGDVISAVVAPAEEQVEAQSEESQAEETQEESPQAPAEETPTEEAQPASEQQEAAPQAEQAKPAKKGQSVDDIINAESRRRTKSKKGAESESDQIKLQWYIVQAYSGQEQKAKESLKERVAKNKLDQFFGDIQIPEEEVTELARGEKKTVNRKFFPGYMLVEMHINEDTWHLVKDTPKIVGFVGDESNPVPMGDQEVDRLNTQMEEGSTALASGDQYEEGDSIKVVDGPFVDMSGTVEEVKPDKGKLRVLISIFGRATPVELDFYQVEKL